MAMCDDFTALTPDVMLDAVEEQLGERLSGLTHPHQSYINRVYELQTADTERIIAKFYRPGRWNRDALMDEHRFVQECNDAEIPVVAPNALRDGGTLGTAAGIYFAVFPKRWGREFEATCEEDWRRLGRILGRMHLVGATRDAPSRITMHPAKSTRDDVEHLRQGDFVTPQFREAFFDAANSILEQIIPQFQDVPLQRIHGDCHCQNILERPGEGLMMIDFDDMATGPVVQDLWMLLPDRIPGARREINLILEGYETFSEFDDRTLALVEPLRAMRMLYFLAWCSKQMRDPNYAAKFPEWGSDAFWRQQTSDLKQQLDVLIGQ